ncbi:MAG: DUF3786 domain-containing protein [Spirochaetaceae bacterium]|jgi:hypothetical protein|nr:DUF3786 domain-containing protein [Spirochaetaceae bacterium]
MDIFGMEHKKEKGNGKYVWNYKILPKIPIKLMFYEGDDEFPSKLQILYDSNVLKIFNFEQLGVLHVSIFHAILSMDRNKNQTVADPQFMARGFANATNQHNGHIYTQTHKTGLMSITDGPVPTKTFADRSSGTTNRYTGNRLAGK